MRLADCLTELASFWHERDGVDPRLTLRQLTAHRLGLSTGQLLADPQRRLSDDQVHQLCADVARLNRGEPLAHVLGDIPFLDLTLRIDARALIPRPETEALTEQVIEQLRDRPPQRVLDLCCGSGAIGLSIAHAFPHSQVWLSDASPAALAVAEENVRELGLAKRCHLRCGDLWQALEPGLRFDVVVANPPYVAYVDPVADSVLRFEPHVALFSEDHGLAHIKRILRELPQFLTRGGMAAFELGHHHQTQLNPWLRQLKWPGHFRWRQDPFGVPRFLFYDEEPPPRT